MGTENPKIKRQKISTTAAINSLFCIICVYGFYLGATYVKERSCKNIVWRRQWASSLVKDTTFLKLPITRVIITTTGELNCYTRYDCLNNMLLLDLNLSNERTYNFLIGGDGMIYEGTGWPYKASYINGYDHDASIGVAFMGSFLDVKPLPCEIKALKVLLEKGVAWGKLSRDYKIYSHSMFENNSTEPGEKIQNIIKKWPHYAS